MVKLSPEDYKVFRFEYRKEHCRKWRENNRDKYNEYMRNSYNRRIEANPLMKYKYLYGIEIEGSKILFKNKKCFKEHCVKLSHKKYEITHNGISFIRDNKYCNQYLINELEFFLEEVQM